MTARLRPSDGGTARLVVVTAAMTLAALTGGAIVGLLAAAGLLDGGSGTRLDTVAASTTSTTSPDPATGNAPDESGPGDAEDGSGASDRPAAATAGSSTTATSPDPSADASTTSTVGANGPGAESAAVDGEIEQVARFRQLVAADSILSDRLSDQDIEDLAGALCVIAKVEDTTGFATARAQIASEQARDTALTAGEVSGTINAAVRAFCPADADRLGL